MLKALSRSLSFRLFAIFLILAGSFAYGAITAVRWVYNSEDIRGLISGHLSLHVYYVLQDIGNPPRIDRAVAITERVPVDIRILGPGIDWASDPEFPRLEDLEFGPSPAFSDNPGAWVNELSGVQFATQDGHNYLSMATGDYDIVVVSPRIADTRSGPDLTVIIVGLGLTFLLFGYFAVSWLFKPIRAIRAGASLIGAGNFDHRIESTRSDQLGSLARDINQLAQNVESMLNAKRALLLGISHELRTPLSRLRIACELLDDEDEREAMKAEIAEMEKIVVTLLEAERLNERHAILARSRVRVGDLVDDMVDSYFDRDRDRLYIDNRAEDLELSIDEARIMLCLKNLISNALRYSPESSGKVELTVRASQYEIVFRVQDHGPGISDDQAAHLGEPFYRSDPSRARETGGSGLGLYLAMMVAKAHGGGLKLVDRGATGACFEVSLPLSLNK